MGVSPPCAIVGFEQSWLLVNGACFHRRLTRAAALLPKTTPIPRQTLEQLQKQGAEQRDKDEKLSMLLEDMCAGWNGVLSESNAKRSGFRQPTVCQG